MKGQTASAAVSSTPISSPLRRRGMATNRVAIQPLSASASITNQGGVGSRTAAKGKSPTACTAFVNQPVAYPSGRESARLAAGQMIPASRDKA